VYTIYIYIYKILILLKTFITLLENKNRTLFANYGVKLMQKYEDNNKYEHIQSYYFAI